MVTTERQSENSNLDTLQREHECYRVSPSWQTGLFSWGLLFFFLFWLNCETSRSLQDSSLKQKYDGSALKSDCAHCCRPRERLHMFPVRGLRQDNVVSARLGSIKLHLWSIFKTIEVDQIAAQILGGKRTDMHTTQSIIAHHSKQHNTTLHPRECATQTGVKKLHVSSSTWTEGRSRKGGS